MRQDRDQQDEAELAVPLEDQLRADPPFQQADPAAQRHLDQQHVAGDQAGDATTGDEQLAAVVQRLRRGVQPPQGEADRQSPPTGPAQATAARPSHEQPAGAEAAGARRCGHHPTPRIVEEAHPLMR